MIGRDSFYRFYQQCLNINKQNETNLKIMIFYLGVRPFVDNLNVFESSSVGFLFTLFKQFQ